MRIGLLYERLAHIRRAAGDPAGARAASQPCGRAGPARPESGARDGPRVAWRSCTCSTASSRTPSGWPGRRSRSPAPAIPWRATRRSTRRRRSAWRSPGDAIPNAAHRAAARGRARRPRDRRPRRAVPRHRQPDDGPRSRRPPGRGRRRRVPRHRRCPARRPGSRLRQLPRGQRHRVADPARPLGGGARAERPGAGVAAGRRRLPDGHASSWPSSRSRPRPAAQAAAPARPDGARVRCAARAAARGSVLPGGGLVRALARRRRRCRPFGRPWLGRGPDRPRSGCSRRGWRRWSRRWTRRSAPRRASAASSLRWPPRGPARRRSSRRRSDLVEAGGAPPIDRIAQGRRGLPRDGARRSSAAWRATTIAAVWAKVATMWQALAAPYEVALARWRQAEATLASGRRACRAHACPQAARWSRSALAVGLEARPLLRNLRELAGRARIELPEEVDRVLGDVRRRRRPRPARRRHPRPLAAATVTPATVAPTSSARSPAIRLPRARGRTRSA